MRNLTKVSNPRSDDKVIDACSIFGMMDTSGKRFSGDKIIRAIANMHDRSNGLGGGFAVYGLYPQHADSYALHVMFLNKEAKAEAESFLKQRFSIIDAEEVPTRPVRAIANPPLVWRYFARAPSEDLAGQNEDDYVVNQVMELNTSCDGSFVFSSGKDVGIFKGVGYAEEIAEYFCLHRYQGYLWTAHGRFPTNTPGWWGGAHPFGILDWTVVHNGEISSYGINRRYLEQFGYECTMQTDTEVIAYAIDLLVRKHRLPIEIAAKVLAPPLWSEIERCPVEEQALLIALRQVYGSLLLNGPFAVIIAHRGEMIGLTDRIKLRPLIAGEKGTIMFLSSEESAIRLVCPDVDYVWAPTSGQPVIGRLGMPSGQSYRPEVGKGPVRVARVC